MWTNREREWHETAEQPPAKVILVDDDPLVLNSLSFLLSSAGYMVRTYDAAGKALAGFITEPADVVVTDVHMPEMNGIELLKSIRVVDGETPVIFMTGYAELDVALAAVKMRAFEIIFKPFNPGMLIDVVGKGVDYKRAQDHRTAMERKMAAKTSRLAEVRNIEKTMSREIIERLTAAAELHDEETGMHISRIGLYVNCISRALGMPEDFAAMITVASTMHDIGKIGIPDAVLFKESPLSVDEFAIIKTHTAIGERILHGSPHPMLQMAAAIALNHHERWDGTGYPNALRGEAIPLVGRIVMLADQYDALRSKRVYKPAHDHATASAIIIEGDGRTRPEHFDPRVLMAFKGATSHFADIFDQNLEEAAHGRNALHELNKLRHSLGVAHAPRG